MLSFAFVSLTFSSSTNTSYVHGGQSTIVNLVGHLRQPKLATLRPFPEVLVDQVLLNVLPNLIICLQCIAMHENALLEFFGDHMR